MFTSINDWKTNEASTTSNPDDKILNKITKAICKTIKDKMGGKITKEMDLKDMVLDYMGANGYGEDKKVGSQVVKMVKDEFKGKKEKVNEGSDYNYQQFHEEFQQLVEKYQNLLEIDEMSEAVQDIFYYLQKHKDGN